MPTKVRWGSMLSKKSFGGNKQKFSKGPDAFRAQRGEGPHRVSKKRHGPSYRHYRASQRRGSPKITFCEIFGCRPAPGLMVGWDDEIGSSIMRPLLTTALTLVSTGALAGRDWVNPSILQQQNYQALGRAPQRRAPTRLSMLPDRRQFKRCRLRLPIINHLSRPRPLRLPTFNHPSRSRRESAASIFRPRFPSIPPPHRG